MTLDPVSRAIFRGLKESLSNVFLKRTLTDCKGGVEGLLRITMLFVGFVDNLPKPPMPLRFPGRTLLRTACKQRFASSSGNRYGDRPQLDRQAVWNEMVRHPPPVLHWTRWAPVTGPDLKRAALSCRGSAAGLDGWTTEELLQFSDGMWRELAGFYLECDNCSRIPKAWRQTRQIHLGKGEPREQDGSMLAANLRPISVTSLIWRICRKVRFRHNDTQAWLKRVMPDCVYGGIPWKGTQDAAGPLLYQTHRYWFLGTMDLETVNPKPQTLNPKPQTLNPKP